jgi:hypothetical protein
MRYIYAFILAATMAFALPTDDQIKAVTLERSLGASLDTRESACSDNSPNCSSWAAAGLCSNLKFDEVTRRAFCEKTCGLC